MRRWLITLIAVATLGAAGAWAYARSSSAESTFVCPLTGEELPCPNCCPLTK